MEKEKKFKAHGDRNDLAGEHFFGDIGQIIALIIFLVAWIMDSLLVRTRETAARLTVLRLV